MSRATSVWVVLDHRNDVKAAFTVRHELVSWLNLQDSLTGWTALRLPDGRWRDKPIGRFHAEDLLPLGDYDRL